MNEKYRLNFYILGVDDALADQLVSQQIEINRKGDIWNKRTGKKYEENIVKKTLYTTYEEGFQPIVDELIVFTEQNPFMGALLEDSREVSLQICVDLDDDCRVPYICFTTRQLVFFSKINSEIDFHIS